MSVVSLPQGYENKVLTGDKLYTLVSLIKQELANKATTYDLVQTMGDFFTTNGIWIENNGINIETTDDNTGDEFSAGMNENGFGIHHSAAEQFEKTAAYGIEDATYEFKNITDELYYSGSYGSGGFGISVYEYDSQNDEIGSGIATLDISTDTSGTIQMETQDGNGNPIPVVLNGEQLATVGGIISDLGGDPIADTLADAVESSLVYRLNGTPGTDTIAEAVVNFLIDNELSGTPGTDTLANAIEYNVEEFIVGQLGGTPGTDTLVNAVNALMPDISGKQDALVFNTAYNASSNKVATMSDVSGKQDALVFNTAYNASSNKVATMADIPSVSGFQTASDVQTAITTAISGITSFSFEIVQALPVSNISQTTIYLVLKSSGPSGNIYTEYAYVKTGTDSVTGNDIYGWETLGDTQADIAVLSTAEVTAIWNYEPPAEPEEDPGL